MTSTSRADEIRNAQRDAWAALAAGWAKWDGLIQQQLAPLGVAIIGGLRVAEDQEHLDVASGTGEPGLSIAHLAPRGRVVLTDIAAPMLEFAAGQAQAQGLDNVETKVCSADDLPFADASFDSVSVRLGYMFLPDLAAATAEFARVLRPGGRIAAAVWIEPERNPWTAIIMDAIAGEVSLPPPDPDAPNMFRCAAPGQIGALYVQAGLHDVVESDVEVVLVTHSAQEYWEVMTEKVSIAVAALKQVDAPTRERIRANAIRMVSDYEHDGQVRVPGRARCIVGTK